MRKILLFMVCLYPLTSFSKPFEPRDRYEEIEPCQDYIEPFLECRTNLELYFRSCKRKSGKKFISCLFKRAGGLMSKDPLAYWPKKKDPKGITAITEYRKSEDYKERLSILEDDLRFFEDYTFCVLIKGSKFRWKYDAHKSELRYSTRLFPTSKGKRKIIFSNVPASDKALHFTATPKTAKYFMQKRNNRSVIFFRFTKDVIEGSLEVRATDIAFCKGRKCKPEFSVDTTGEVHRER